MQFLKPTLPVQWHEGMLLSPQHFQQEAESLRSAFAFHQALATPYGWGFETLQIDESLLPAGRVRLLTARLVFPDGTAVWYDAQTDEELTLDLMAADAEFEAGPVDLFLRLPISPNSIHLRDSAAIAQWSRHPSRTVSLRPCLLTSHDSEWP